MAARSSSRGRFLNQRLIAASSGTSSMSPIASCDVNQSVNVSCSRLNSKISSYTLHSTDVKRCSSRLWDSCRSRVTSLNALCTTAVPSDVVVSEMTPSIHPTVPSARLIWVSNGTACAPARRLATASFTAMRPLPTITPNTSADRVFSRSAYVSNPRMRHAARFADSTRGDSSSVCLTMPQGTASYSCCCCSACCR